MKRKNKLPELLAPAGDIDALFAAILGGADAVYVGGERFGARAFAKNFSPEQLLLAVKLCHMHGVRIYVTLNTLIFDKEIDEALSYAEELYRMGVDALIVADLGIATLIRKRIPDFELHASTQMGVHNTEGVNFAAALGCKRVVLARECSGEDIKKIVEKSNAECEVFLHGALCVCHSGQCLFSSLVGGRSGNRGECAQPCRLPYNNGKYPLSLSDLSLANHVKELISSGVASLKIEGRMKSPAYVYEVTRIYRSLLDGVRNASPEENRRLREIFSRGGFTDGYFTGRVFEKMTGVRTDEDKRTSREISVTEFALPKIKVSASASFKRGEACSLSLSALVYPRWSSEKEAAVKEPARVCVTVFGDVPNVAENSPLTKEGLLARLSKMGNTPFSLAADDIEISLDEGINLSPSSINALRREASSLLEECFAAPIDKMGKEREVDGESKEDFSLPHFDKRNESLTSTALFFNYRALMQAMQKNPGLLSGIDVVFVPLFDYKNLEENMRKAVTGVYIPPVIIEKEWEEVKAEITNASELGARYALVGNISHLALISDSKLLPVGDFRLNVTNKYTREFYASVGVCDVILSPELTLPQARDVGGIVITLGRIPLMITERCFTKENFGCESCGKAALTDRKGAKFPLLREYSHRNVIFNSSPTYMGDKKAELKAARINKTHFIFSSESASEALELLSLYKLGKALALPHRRVGKR
ncbi:MAG: U32 family peptidase [Clostridia bacterium]|nr:U32 family peptidase [Clostridia bacterium]